MVNGRKHAFYDLFYKKSPFAKCANGDKNVKTGRPFYINFQIIAS